MYSFHLLSHFLSIFFFYFLFYSSSLFFSYSLLSPLFLFLFKNERYLKRIFKDLFERQAFEDDGVYDWDMLKKKQEQGKY